jgi:hypothetical protein
VRSPATRGIQLALALLAAVGWAVGPAPRPVVAVEGYELETSARYDVRIDAGQIGVQVRIEFTNLTPDPAGRFSVFEEVKLAIHDQAERVAARDEQGALDVGVAVEDGVNVATIALREGLRHEDTAALRLTYVLPDTDSPHLRVRPSLVVFPAWGFGTAGTVEVLVPGGYEVRVDGDPLTDEGGALVSGPIPDPSAWLALVTAVRPTEYAEYDAVVPLAGGTADLLVRAFEDDAAWGERTLALIADALPRIEEALGLPYPRTGQLVLTEAVASDASGFGEESTGGTEIMVAYDQPAFTALHQVAHVWLSPGLVEARWLREGLASAVAAEVAAELALDLPYDPAERAASLAGSAVPLDAWGGSSDPQTEAYGYAASWAFVEELQAAVGAEAVRAVLARVAAGVGPYEATAVDAAPPEADVAPVDALDTRAFIDHLETVTGQSVAERFAEDVLVEADRALLADRAGARAAFDGLVADANGWGAPNAVLGAMAAWDFTTARARIAEAAAWLEQRDALLAEIDAVRLSAPERLIQAYRAYGGGAEALEEVETERAVVRAYADAAAAVNAERSFLERVGLIGGEDPSSRLNQASGRFADGDLRGAVDAIADAERIVDAAATAGVVRIASALLLAVIVLGIAVFLVRRRASYTAAP